MNKSNYGRKKKKEYEESNKEINNKQVLIMNN